MDIEKLEVVRQAIVEEKVAFDYSTYVMVEGFAERECRYATDCCTTACVAGMTVLLFPQGKKADSSLIGCVAQEILDLTEEQTDFLFHDHSNDANKDDALKRIDHLLSESFIDEYDWDQESHGLGDPEYV